MGDVALGTPSKVPSPFLEDAPQAFFGFIYEGHPLDTQPDLDKVTLLGCRVEWR